MINSDGVAAWLRTVVPTAWGALIAIIASRFPAVHEMLVNPAVTMALTGLVVAAWYSLWRAMEPKLPAWLTVVLLGYDRPPTYFTGSVYETGYQAGQDDAVPQMSAEALDEFKRRFEESLKKDPPTFTERPRSVSRPGESSGPHAYTDVMPAVPADETPEEPRRDG